MSESSELASCLKGSTKFQLENQKLKEENTKLESEAKEDEKEIAKYRDNNVEIPQGASVSTENARNYDEDGYPHCDRVLKEALTKQGIQFSNPQKNLKNLVENINLKPNDCPPILSAAVIIQPTKSSSYPDENTSYSTVRYLNIDVQFIFKGR